MKVGRSLGRVSVLVAARPGLVADRLRARNALEGLRLLEEGASAPQIDRVLYDFGIPKGWDSALEQDPLGGSRGLGSHGRDGAGRKISDQEVLERCVFSMINEAARVLEEKVVTRALEIDMICVHGNGFPVYRGGPLFYADELGLAAVHRSHHQVCRRSRCAHVDAGRASGATRACRRSFLRRGGRASLRGAFDAAFAHEPTAPTGPKVGRGRRRLERARQSGAPGHAGARAVSRGGDPDQPKGWRDPRATSFSLAHRSSRGLSISCLFAVPATGLRRAQCAKPSSVAAAAA